VAIKEQVIKKSALSPTVLIAGGAGFIGSHLSQALLQRDARVIVLDNFKTGKDVYINSLLENPKFAVFDTDINEGLPKNIHSVDYIIHLAGVESYLYTRDAVSLDSLLTSTLGTKNLLDLARKSEAKFLLVSSVDVLQAQPSPIDLDSYFGETLEEEKRYSLSEAKRFAEALVWEYYKNNQTDVRITRLPEVYGPRMNLASTGNLGHLLKNLLENKSLEVYGDGTEKEYYLYISDVVSGLIKSLFNKGTDGKIFTLAPEEPHAVLEIAYLLKSVASGRTQIDFKRKVDGSENFFSTKVLDRTDLGALKWEPKIDFKQGLTQTLGWFGYETNEHSFKPNKLIQKRKDEKAEQRGALVSTLVGAKDTAVERITQLVSDAEEFVEERLEVKTKSKRKRVSLPKLKFPQFSQRAGIIIGISIALFIFVLLPFIQTGINASFGVSALKKIPQDLSQMDAEKAKNDANSSFQRLHSSQSSLARSRWLFTAVGKQETFSSYAALLSSATHFARGTYYISKAAMPFTQIWETIKPNSSLQLDENAFVNAQANLTEAKNSLQRAQADYKRVNQNALTKNLSAKATEYENILNSLTKHVDDAAVLSSEIPNLFGTKDEMKRYLILFQNSNEIRPTGGFIGSYALVEVQNGKIINLTIDDIYNPDGQIDIQNVKVAPPAVLGKLLNEDRAYLRNSNWNPDFPESAAIIRSLYEQVSGKRIDGVAAVDLYFAENILRVTGPVFLTAFGEEITADNLYERAQLHSEFNYENGSAQKKVFLTIFGGKLLEAIFALPNEKMPDLLREVSKALQEKHLLLTLSGSSFNAVLEENNWDGSLADTDAESSDYLYVVNSNVGGTKANYFVQNQMSYTVTSQTRDGLLRGILALNYNHTGKDMAWPGGPYKDYVRVLTQNGTNLTGATLAVNGTTTDIFKEMVIDKVQNYNSFETLLELNPQESAQLTLYYDLPAPLSINNQNEKYNLYWQKQPGTRADQIILRFEPPFGLKVDGKGQVLLEESLSTDKIFHLSLQ